MCAQSSDRYNRLMSSEPTTEVHSKACPLAQKTTAIRLPFNSYCIPQAGIASRDRDLGNSLPPRTRNAQHACGETGHARRESVHVSATLA